MVAQSAESACAHGFHSTVEGLGVLAVRGSPADAVPLAIKIIALSMVISAAVRRIVIADILSRRLDRGFTIGMTSYVLYVLGLSVLLETLHYRPSTPIGILLAVPPTVAAGYAMVSQFRRVDGKEGIERQIQTQAITAAFFTTMLGVLTYGLLEAYAGLPHLSMWFGWGFGMAARGVAVVLLRHRYS